jgi:hypothetical protein
MNFEDHKATEHKGEFEDMKIMQDENPEKMQDSKLKKKLEFADTAFLHAYKDYLLQPFPRQQGWPVLNRQ